MLPASSLHVQLKDELEVANDALKSLSIHFAVATRILIGKKVAVMAHKEEECGFWLSQMVPSCILRSFQLPRGRFGFCRDHLQTARF